MDEDVETLAVLDQVVQQMNRVAGAPESVQDIGHYCLYYTLWGDYAVKRVVNRARGVDLILDFQGAEELRQAMEAWMKAYPYVQEDMA